MGNVERTNPIRKWKFHFLAVHSPYDAGWCERWIHAETKEDAVSKLKEDFRKSSRLENITLVDAA